MNIYYIGSIPVSDELYHHGILGQKWGIRRYQNPDGSLTEEGRKRYGRGVSKERAFNNFMKEDKATQLQILEKYSTVDMKTVKRDLSRWRPNKDALWDDFNGVQEKMIKESDEAKKQEENKKREIGRLNNELKSDDVGGYTKGYLGWGKEPPSKRYADAADTGLRSMEKLGLLNFDYEKDNDGHYDNWTRDWFVWEDQTIGLADISDLINRGKSKKQVMDYADRAFKLSQKYLETPSGEAFNLAEARGQYGSEFLSNFIDGCLESRAIKHGMQFANIYIGKNL